MSYEIYPLNPDSLALPFTVFGIGFEDNQPHVIRKEGFPTHQIFICISGEGTLKVNKNTYIITEGTFFYLQSNIPHEYYGNTEKWAVNWISFSGNQIDQLMAGLKFDTTKVNVYHNWNNIDSLYKKIFLSLKTDNDTGKLTASNTLYEIIVELYKILHTGQNDTPKESQIIQDVTLYIEEHYDRTISLEELAELTAITPQYLCRLFKKHMNLRPFQYITMKRIQHAKKLLSSSSLSVNHIAELVGFNDCSYFCAVFKKYEKISPSEFRGK